MQSSQWGPGSTISCNLTRCMVLEEWVQDSSWWVAIISSTKTITRFVCGPTTMKSLGQLNIFYVVEEMVCPTRLLLLLLQLDWKGTAILRKRERVAKRVKILETWNTHGEVFNVVKTSKITKWSQLSWQSYNVRFTCKIQLNYKWITCIEKWLLDIITPNQHLNIVS